jgi:glycosyltransferase involved in cell wall biosynthesis
VIALLHPAPAYGAVERYVEAIARGLGDEAVLVHPGVPQFERLPVRTVQLRDPSTWALARLVRRLRPRVVHVTDVWPQALVAARVARVPRLLVTHHTPQLPRYDNVAGRVWWHLGWRCRPEVVYTSQADQVRDGRRPAHVIALGIDLDRFTGGTAVLPRNGPVIGNVGRLAPQKGHRYLIEAAPPVLERHPDARFVVVGDGELRDELERTARDRGVSEHFLFTGARTDVPELLASFDVFAFPSLFEGMCVAVIEAQAAGVPVVATPVGGIPDTVVDGATGLLVPPRDAAGLADGILQLLDDPGAGRRLADEARRRAVERFSQERMVAETLRLYRG